ncbi:interferon lambda-3-like [Lepidochelys kempii]|uniref:interferon lambda-3-like n=1 Tax=Lepidochelys kempii TaxID=8472 RepID=UPI003C6EA5F9
MSRTLLVSALLLVLVETFAEGAPAKNCQLSQYRSLLPQYIQAFKDFRDKYGKTIQGAVMNCSDKIFSHKLDQLPACQNLVVLEKKVDLTIRVIQNLSEPELVRSASGPLEILASIEEDLRSCVMKSNVPQANREGIGSRQFGFSGGANAQPEPGESLGGRRLVPCNERQAENSCWLPSAHQSGGPFVTRSAPTFRSS